MASWPQITKPFAWHAEFESSARMRYAWTLSADWPRLARVQTLISNLIDVDAVVYDWPHIQAPTLSFGGAEDMLAGTPAAFQEGMKRIVAASPNGTAPSSYFPASATSPSWSPPSAPCPRSSPSSKRELRSKRTA